MAVKVITTIFWLSTFTSLSHFDVLGEELRLFYKAALLEDHLMDLELCHVVDRAHSVINFMLALLSKRTINCLVINASAAILFIQIGIIQCLIQNAAKSLSRIKFDPRRSKHEVDVAFELVSPELDDTA